jgi:ankyrin repeat protein
MTRNDNGDTPLHAAAYEGHLDQVPAAILTPERVATRNYDGISVAALAAEKGFISQIPEASRPRSLGPVSRFLRRISRTRSPF